MTAITLTDLFDIQTVHHTLKTRVRTMDYDWAPIAHHLAPHIKDPRTAKEGDILAVAQTYKTIESKHKAPIKAMADYTCALSFRLDEAEANFFNPQNTDLWDALPLEYGTLLCQTHDHEKRPIPNINQLLSPFSGRKQLTQWIDILRWKEEEANQEPTHTHVLALYRPEGIVLVTKADDDDLTQYAKKGNTDTQAFCTLITPTPKSAHETFEQEENLDSLLAFANIFFLTRLNGVHLTWTR